MAIIRLIVTLNILLYKRAMMWRSQHQSLLCSVYRLYRWKEAVRDQNYMLLWWRRASWHGWHSLRSLFEVFGYQNVSGIKFCTKRLPLCAFWRTAIGDRFCNYYWNSIVYRTRQTGIWAWQNWMYTSQTKCQCLSECLNTLCVCA